jgi:hypothetical protein
MPNNRAADHSTRTTNSPMRRVAINCLTSARGHTHGARSMMARGDSQSWLVLPGVLLPVVNVCFVALVDKNMFRHAHTSCYLEPFRKNPKQQWLAVILLREHQAFLAAAVVEDLDP